MSDLGRLMFRIISLSLAIGLVTSRPVKAGPVVSYSTSGTFDVNSTTGSTIELNKGNFTIELFYTGTTQANLAVPDSTAPFGTFTIDVVENGKANLSTSGTFDLMLSQTDPTNSNGTFTSDISGSVQLGTSNDVTVTFNSPPNPITFGAITYTLPGSITLASPPAKTAFASSTTDLTANISGITTGSVPEPSSLILATAGAAMGLVYAGWRCRRKRELLHGF
jgi:PEP-CTERM motif